VEFGDIDGVDIGTAGTDNHRVSSTGFDDANGFGKCEQCGGIAAGDGIVWAAGIVVDGHVTGRHAGQLSQQPERCHFSDGFLPPEVGAEAAFGAAGFDDGSQFLGMAGHATGTEDNTETIGIDLTRRNAGIADGEVGGGDAELHAAAHDFDKFAVAEQFYGVEVAHLGPEGRRQTFCRQEIAGSQFPSGL
jgi:hypothetical protein